MRKPFIAGNWKMNKTASEAVELVVELKDKVAGISDVEIAVCTPAVDLVSVQGVIKDSNIALGAQNMYWEESGAFTGEISGPMLTELGVSYVIIGHSERREYFGETDEDVNRKAKAAFKYGLKPIICVGETLEEREAGKTEDKVSGQIKADLAGLSNEQVAELVIAYEPIWAIGTGKTATSEEANSVIKYIRDLVREGFGDTADKVRIQYGGSVKPHNVEELMAQKEIDGALVGGASLDAESFTSIVKGAL
ncbi:triose-phosphate isomerase [Iocasia frigidifontis]|uniref:Triosephosphate isomerase n=1 Tax=Iocasia fonsfrigidae TaxID=2682810 RepID=A0A8A7KAE6_9FIRM|nr:MULTISPECIES: triose-phosphate isomerase [Halanaerobiaceae]AZO94148.1 triose-phosphate isomerase [Halocella sp. SP3-1]QTL97065.1 triose-phosphate isomerase [Iocasia fonsfrigidae]